MPKQEPTIAELAGRIEALEVKEAARKAAAKEIRKLRKAKP